MDLPRPAASRLTSREGPIARARRGRLMAARWLSRCAVALLAAQSAHAAPWAVRLRTASGAPLADAVVAVELNGQPAKPATQATAQMEQRKREFQPHVLVVQTGTAVSFPNFDTVRHHVYSFSPTKTFDIRLYAGTPAQPVVFDRPGVATLGCNIHDRMSAHVVVVDTPLFGKSDAQGWLRLDLPPGQHRLLLWHPRFDAPTLHSQPLTVDKDGTPLELTLELAD